MNNIFSGYRTRFLSYVSSPITFSMYVEFVRSRTTIMHSNVFSSLSLPHCVTILISCSWLLLSHISYELHDWSLKQRFSLHHAVPKRFKRANPARSFVSTQILQRFCSGLWHIMCSLPALAPRLPSASDRKASHSTAFSSLFLSINYRASSSLSKDVKKCFERGLDSTDCIAI